MRRSSSPTLDPDHLLTREGALWAVSPTLPDAQAAGGRLEPADAGLAGVRLKDDFTHLTPRGWYLSANLLCLFSPGRKTPLYQKLEWVRGLTATHGASGLRMQPQESERSSFPQALSELPCVSLGHWAGCNSMQDRKYLLKKLSEWDPSLLQARLAMEC